MFFLKKSKDLPALLTKYFRRKELLCLVGECKDARLLLSQAAAKLGISEEELSFNVSRRGGYRFCPVVQPFDLTLMAGRCTLPQLYKAGAILQAAGDVISSVVCVDPGLVEALPFRFERIQTALAPWGRIRAALGQSEEDYRAKAAGDKWDERSKQVLVLIISEAKKFGATELKVNLEARPSYSFRSGEGREASGTLSSAVREGLSRVLSGAQGTSVFFRYEKQNARFKVISSGGSEFLLAWGEERSLAPFRSIEIAQPSEASSNLVEFPAEEAQRRVPASLSGCEVLLIDDNACFAKVFERFFARHSLKSSHISSCQEAMAKLKAGEINPDLVVCDVHMNGMSGFEFLRALRPLFPDLPIIMLTSDEDVETQLLLLRDGADAFVGKTQDPRILCTQAVRLLSRRRAA